MFVKLNDTTFQVKRVLRIERIDTRGADWYIEKFPRIASIMGYLCQKNPYLKKLITNVVSCVPYMQENKTATNNGYVIELNESLFFPEGGGQPADFGKIGPANVLWVERQPNKILHRVDVSLDVGAEVECTLDWSRRYDHMQQHSGQHLLSAIFDHYNIATVSWELGNSTCNIDLKVDKNKMDTQFLSQIEEEVNNKIRQALPVIAHEYSIDELDTLIGQGRLKVKPSTTNGLTSYSFIEIKDTDFNMCCGTHVKSLAELQMIKLLFTESMRGNTRLYFICGQRVVDRFSNLHQYEKDMIKLLKCQSRDHIRKVDDCLKSLKLCEKSKSNLLREMAKNDAITIRKNTQKFVCIHKEDYDGIYLNHLLKELSRDSKVGGDKVAMIVCGPSSGPGVFGVKASEEFFNKYEKMILTALNAKGKSRNGILQGKADNLKSINNLVAQFEKITI